MPHFLSRAEANALHYLALALRTDWEHNRPGPTWQKELGNTWPTLPHADDFRHALRALVLFADRKADDSTHIMRTPKPYVTGGRHWDETRRADSDAPKRICPDHPHDRNDKTRCIGCNSEIKTGMRPANYLGEHYDPAEDGHPGVAQTPQSDQELPLGDGRTYADTAGRDEDSPRIDWEP